MHIMDPKLQCTCMAYKCLMKHAWVHTFEQTDNCTYMKITFYVSALTHVYVHVQQNH